MRWIGRKGERVRGRTQYTSVNESAMSQVSVQTFAHLKFVSRTARHAIKLSELLSHRQPSTRMYDGHIG